jgi:hypothetical protein
MLAPLVAAAAVVDGLRFTDWIAAAGISRSTAFELVKILGLDLERRSIPGVRSIRAVSYVDANQRQVLDAYAADLRSGALTLAGLKRDPRFVAALPPTDQMKIKQVTMTPEWARTILACNDRNRPHRRSLVDQIADDIKKGRWILTPQTVSIAKDGQLLDGQHRLMAILSSGIPVQLMLATDCDAACFRAIDTGVSRSAGDILRVDGLVGNANSIAAAVRLTILYRECPGITWTGPQSQVTKQRILEVYRNDSAAFDAASRTALSKQQAKSIKARNSSVAAFLYLYSSSLAPGRDDAELSREYYSLFCSGEMLESGNAILSFRNWLINNADTSKSAQVQLACHIKAYKLWKTNTRIKRFISPTYVPMPAL